MTLTINDTDQEKTTEKHTDKTTPKKAKKPTKRAKRTKKLTPKEEVFVREIVKGRNQIDAYLTAYPESAGVSKKSLYYMSSYKAHRPKIVEKIEQLRKPIEDLLKEYQAEIIQTAINAALGKISDKSINTAVLTKLLDKILATKTESKSETVHIIKVIFNNIKQQTAQSTETAAVVVDDSKALQQPKSL